MSQPSTDTRFIGASLQTGDAGRIFSTSEPLKNLFFPEFQKNSLSADYKRRKPPNCAAKRKRLGSPAATLRAGRQKP